MLLECLCLFVFIIRLFHVWCFAPGVKFWRDKKTVIFLAVIVVRYLSNYILQEADNEIRALSKENLHFKFSNK